MNAEKKQLIKKLLNSFGQKCTYMTHNLAELGNGDMAEGLVALYHSGQLNGIVIGAGSVTALVATYHVGKAIINGVNTKKAIRQTATEQEALKEIADHKADPPLSPPAPLDSSDAESTSPTPLSTDNVHNSHQSSISSQA